MSKRQQSKGWHIQALHTRRVDLWRFLERICDTWKPWQLRIESLLKCSESSLSSRQIFLQIYYNETGWQLIRLITKWMQLRIIEEYPSTAKRFYSQKQSSMLNIEFEWLNDFVVKLSKLRGEDAINRAIKKWIFTIERAAKIETPVDTGILRNSYTTEFDSLIWRLVNFRDYAIYVHEWTRFQKPNPFLERAVMQTEQQVETIFSNEYDALLKTLE